MPRVRSIGSVKGELITKAVESALCAIKVFNDPLIRFKSEAFIILIIVAWTYLLHAYYRSKRIDYRYFKQGKKRKTYDRTKHGAKKHWELERCLNDTACPIDGDTQNNLRFLIGLRHEIEHQMTKALDNHLSARYQAAVLNFNAYLKSLFGDRHALDNFLTYSIQFAELAPEQLQAMGTEKGIPKNVRAFIGQFDGGLTHEQYNSPKYSYRLLFKRKLVNKPGQADKVIEFIDPNSELAKAIDKEYWVKKEVEKPKLLPRQVVAEVQKAGFPRFRIQPEHVDMWKAENAKDQQKDTECCFPAGGTGTNLG